MCPLAREVLSCVSCLLDIDRYEGMFFTCLGYGIPVINHDDKSQLTLNSLRAGPSTFLAGSRCTFLGGVAVNCAQFSDEETKGLRESTTGTQPARGRAGI